MTERPPIPSATVLLLRERDGEIEALMLKRNPELKVDGGFWVFPGGKLSDAESRSGSDGFLQAAIRECEEECGIALSATALLPLSRWITPELMPVRFDTAFFIGQVDADIEIQIDNSEIVDYCWLSPAVAIEAQRKGEMPVRPPACVTLANLQQYATVAEILDATREQASVALYEPKGFMLPLGCDPATGETVPKDSEGKGIVFLYNDDAGYADDQPGNVSFRHRLIFDENGMRYFDQNLQRI